MTTRAEAITAIIEANPEYRAACAALEAVYLKHQMTRYTNSASNKAIADAFAAYDNAMEEIMAAAIAEYEGDSWDEPRGEYASADAPICPYCHKNPLPRDEDGDLFSWCNVCDVTTFAE